MKKLMLPLLPLVMLCVYASCERKTSCLNLRLRNPWDDTVVWNEITPSGTITKFSSNPQGEIIIGDATSYYGMSHIRAYFRFVFDHSCAIDKIQHAWLAMYCSYSGNDTPKLKINTVDEQSLQLSALTIDWENNPQDWKWNKHFPYRSPDIAPLLQTYFTKYPNSHEITFVVSNSENNVDQFKGICSFDDEPEYSTRLVIQVYD